VDASNDEKMKKTFWKSQFDDSYTL